MSVRVIEGIEDGTRDPKFSTLVKLCRALQLCSLEQLLGPLPFDRV